MSSQELRAAAWGGPGMCLLLQEHYYIGAVFLIIAVMIVTYRRLS